MHRIGYYALFTLVLWFQSCVNVESCMWAGAECIDYVVLSNNSDYEVRQYPPTVWVSTSIKGSSMVDAMKRMYRRLFYYFDERNVKGLFINTTTPVRTRVTPCVGACRPTFTMSFLIPSALRDDPPLPIDQDLYCEREPAKRYIVRKFGGYPSEMDWIDNAHKLSITLKEEDIVDTSHYYLAFYDPPLKIFNRRNEIWMEKISVDNSISDAETNDAF
ncbi:heme-binding protein 2-like [Centruroides vittatus]|uniref:heme-binding protein 2-like n=1 Tax=Centruroides vittatus TaxID=120091 RepID=UPI0035107266